MPAKFGPGISRGAGSYGNASHFSGIELMSNPLMNGPQGGPSMILPPGSTIHPPSQYAAGAVPQNMRVPAVPKTNLNLQWQGFYQAAPAPAQYAMQPGTYAGAPYAQTPEQVYAQQQYQMQHQQQYAYQQHQQAAAQRDQMMSQQLQQHQTGGVAPPTMYMSGPHSLQQQQQGGTVNGGPQIGGAPTTQQPSMHGQVPPVSGSQPVHQGGAPVSAPTVVPSGPYIPAYRPLQQEQTRPQAAPLEKKTKKVLAIVNPESNKTLRRDTAVDASKKEEDDALKSVKSDQPAPSRTIAAPKTRNILFSPEQLEISGVLKNKVGQVPAPPKYVPSRNSGPSAPAVTAPVPVAAFAVKEKNVPVASVAAQRGDHEPNAALTELQAENSTLTDAIDKLKNRNTELENSLEDVNRKYKKLLMMTGRAGH